MISPKISIIVTVYNQKEYIIECLQSIQKQTYADFECIIIEDGSKQSAEDLIRDFIKDDVRFYYEYKCNGGVSSARNYAINKATGTWILIVDGDDWIAEQTLEWAAPHLIPSNHLVYSNVTYYYKDATIWPNEYAVYSLKSFLLNNCFLIGTFFKKQDWCSCKGFDETMLNGAEDWDFFISIIGLNPQGNIYNLKQRYYVYRYVLSSKNRTLLSKKEDEIGILKYIYEKHSSLYNEVYGGFIKNQLEKNIFEQQVNYYLGNINKNAFTKFLFKLILRL